MKKKILTLKLLHRNAHRNRSRNVKKLYFPLNVADSRRIICNSLKTSTNFTLWWSTCHLGFFSWLLDHVIYPKLRKNYCFQCRENSQNDNYFASKRQPRTILSENSCQFVNLLSFASSSQHEKNHVTHLPTAKN